MRNLHLNVLNSDEPPFFIIFHEIGLQLDWMKALHHQLANLSSNWNLVEETNQKEKYLVIG